jgi:hypothetical protein
MFLSLRALTLGLILATAAIAIIGLPAHASDPLAGTWELNLEKSKFNPGPPPKSQTRTYEVTGQQVRMIMKTIDAKGNEIVHQFSAMRDGKDYPFEGWAIADTISLTPVDTFTMTVKQKKAGEVVVTGTNVISKDGKTMTISLKFTTSTGQQADYLMVFDKR